MNRAERRSKTKKGQSEQPGWEQRKGLGSRSFGGPDKGIVDRGRVRRSQQRGGAKK